MAKISGGGGIIFSLADHVEQILLHAQCFLVLTHFRWVRKSWGKVVIIFILSSSTFTSILDRPTRVILIATHLLN